MFENANGRSPALESGSLAAVLSEAPQVVPVHGRGLETLRAFGVHQNPPGRLLCPSPDL